MHEWPDKPLASISAGHGGVRIVAVNRAAEVAGLRPGLALTDARARVGELETFDADPEGDLAALKSLALWCARYTPWSGFDASASGVWLEITGAAHLFGGERMMLEDLGERLGVFGYAHSLAVADTPGAAWAVARYRRGDVQIVPSGEQKAALVDLPVAALRLAGKTVEGLHRLGLRNVRDLLNAPRAPLVSRFGAEPIHRLDQALGEVNEAIPPLRPTPQFRARMAFVEPIAQTDDVIEALAQLLGAVCRQLLQAGLGARRLCLTCCRVDGTTQERTIGTSRAGRDPEPLARLFREKIDGLDAGFGIEAMILSVAATDPLASEQDEMASSAGRDQDQALGHLVDRLGNRFGPERVRHLQRQARHAPERASRTVSALVPSKPADVMGDNAPAAPRPLRLLPWPDPIDVIAPVPDAPPLLFHWRHRPHRIIRADGPERITPEWWREDPELLNISTERIRDYYRVEDTDGQRFWVFRAGFYRPGQAPKWYLHGFFP